jgi:ribose transport system permease protein/ribose transport system ATP-binding protein
MVSDVTFAAEPEPAAMSGAPRASAAGPDLLSMRGIFKSFGITRAVEDVSLTVRRAEIVGLMGGNGAGKSTLMKIAGGLIAADRGEVSLLGQPVREDHSPAAAMRLGLRFVHQELSLCPNLRVYENFAIELPDIISGLRWRSNAKAFARAALDDVFPGNRIDARAKVSALSLSQQQMVEIARAASHPATRLMILDEPTSSLGATQAEQVRAYMKRRRADGMSFIFISHRLRETLDLADRIVVMRNGSVPWAGATDSIGQPELLRLLGGAAADAAEAGDRPERDHELLVLMDNVHDAGLRGVSLQVGRGEIVGLAGLEGSGQREVLRSVFARRGPVSGRIDVGGEVAFVSGDRAKEGIFHVWSIDDNIAISSLKRMSRWGFVSLRRMREVTSGWFKRLRIRASDGSTPITALSGGNQQKVVIARALAANADVVLLDDPTRGVDLGTKADLYTLFRGLADEGRAVLWYSSDDSEFLECDRTIVMRSGVPVAEFPRHQMTPDRLVEASFRRVDEVAIDAEAQRRIDGARQREAFVPTLIPLLTFAAIFSVCVSQNSGILSSFGLTLVFSAAFGLAFASISQLFIIAAGDIDLGIGPFIGLTNALAATWLVTDPWLAALCFAGLLLAYPLMGLFIHARAVPAIIVTLGMSFVWLGLASLRLPRAGGSAPLWLVDLLRLKPPLLPMPVYLCLLPALIAYVVLMVWRYGAVLRGFGASPRAIEAAGWSTRLAKATLYALAGLFAFLAGIVITASTRGGDPTGAVSMTLLSVAAVILGGASFSGGVVAPIGALFGVLTLVLVGTLLSLLDVNGLYLPMVQGLLLLGVVGLRALLVRRPA